ncbi:hypothetical protein AX16_008302 [Volvariella volvacea WC 439]|nr:hypothetical protein AX16_008302 [Volvariella volvacea WC 439]
MSTSWMSEFIHRSRWAPLTLHINCVPEPQDPVKTLCLIVDAMERVTHFRCYESYVFQASAWVQQLEHLDLSTSPLKSLTIWGCKRMYQNWKPTFELQRLDLNRGHFDGTFISKSLVSLNLQDLDVDNLPTIPKFCQTLSSLTNLRDLGLQRVLTPMAIKTWRLPSSIPDISIPSLQHLQLVYESEQECIRFLSHLFSPNLEGLYIYFDKGVAPSPSLSEELAKVWTDTRILNPPNKPSPELVLLVDISEYSVELVCPDNPEITMIGVRWASGIQSFSSFRLFP